MKLNFRNDYSEGCHPSILEKLMASNMEQLGGYGLDCYSEQAAEFIKGKLGNSEAKVSFVSGGTQANLVVIASLLKPYESVIAVHSGHIFDNETGAIERAGHKVHPVNGKEGKLYPSDVESVLKLHNKQPHQLKPRLVYISNSTEIGTTYTKQELQALYSFCQANDLLLFMDGARLGHALMASDNDLSIKDVGVFTDVFYIGGTKNGALLGEAIVFKDALQHKDFEYYLKQHGALLAKGRLLGIQFNVLFEDELYFNLADHANKQADKIRKAFIRKGILFWQKTATNQLFPQVSKAQYDALSSVADFYIWSEIDNGQYALRIITSWATYDAAVDDFCKAIDQL